MSEFLKRYKWLILLAVLVAINLAVYQPWKKKPSMAKGRPPGPGPGMMRDGRPPEPSAEMKARMEERLAKMSPEERAAFEERRKADQAFFESVRGLPEAERREKMREYMAKNPPPGPPPGMDGAGPGGGGPRPDGAGGGSGGDSGGGPGGPGGDSHVHVPSADVRRGMDEQIANGQRTGTP